MDKRELIIHRLRDFDSVVRARNKFLPLTFVVLRQLYKLFGKDEKRINFLIKNNLSRLKGNNFFTREKTLDFLFFSKYYEPETTEFLINKNGKTFVDVGGHIGRFAILASKRFEKVHVFEPHPENYSMLMRNIKLNRIKNIEAHNLALSNKKGFLHMGSLKMNTGAAKTMNSGQFKVRAEKLDELFIIKKIDPKNTEVIMIDAEDTELDVLKGAEGFLKKTNANLIIESFEISKISPFLKRWGYERVRILDFYNHLFVKISRD